MVQALYTSVSFLKAGQLSAAPVLPLLMLLNFKSIAPNLRHFERGFGFDAVLFAN